MLPVITCLGAIDSAVFRAFLARMLMCRVFSWGSSAANAIDDALERIKPSHVSIPGKALPSSASYGTHVRGVDQQVELP